MKKLLCIISIFSCTTLSLYGSGVMQSIADFSATRAMNKILAAKAATHSDEDSDDIFSSFAAKHLASYGLYSTDLEAILEQIKKTNTERDKTYKARAKQVPPAGCDTFKNYRLMAERYRYPNIPELLQTCLQTLKVLAEIGDETLANIKKKIEKKYDDDESERNKKLEVVDKAIGVIKRQQTTLSDYFYEIKITSTKSLPTPEQMNALMNGANNFEQALENAAHKNPFYTSLLAPQLDLTLTGSYNPITVDFDAEVKKYAAFWKLKPDEINALGTKLSTATNGMFNQLINASTILATQLNGSIFLNNKIADIQETILASGVLVTQARVIAVDIRNQCIAATKILVQMLQNCHGRMSFDSASGDEATTMAVMKMFTPLLSGGDCDATALSRADICQELRKIAVYAKQDATFFQTYSDNYAFPKAGLRLWTPRFGSSEIDIVAGTAQKFETDTQLQNAKTPSIPSPQASLSTCIQQIPEIAQTNEIGFLVNQLGFYYLLVTAFTTQEAFDYHDMVLKKFAYTDPTGKDANPVATKWAPGADDATSPAAVAAAVVGTNDNPEAAPTVEPATAAATGATGDTAGPDAVKPATTGSTGAAPEAPVQPTEAKKYSARLNSTQVTITVTDANGVSIDDIKEIWVKTTLAALPAPPLILTKDNSNFLSIIATKSDDGSYAITGADFTATDPELKPAADAFTKIFPTDSQ